jgi:hypothetical protein
MLVAVFSSINVVQLYEYTMGVSELIKRVWVYEYIRVVFLINFIAIHIYNHPMYGCIGVWVYGYTGV